MPQSRKPRRRRAERSDDERARRRDMLIEAQFERRTAALFLISLTSILVAALAMSGILHGGDSFCALRRSETSVALVLIGVVILLVAGLAKTAFVIATGRIEAKVESFAALAVYVAMGGGTYLWIALTYLERGCPS